MHITARYDMAESPRDHTLEFLLAFDRRVHHWGRATGSSSTSRVDTTTERPHGLSYSFLLHAGDGRRLVGFDAVAAGASRTLTRQPSRHASPNLSTSWRERARSK